MDDCVFCKIVKGDIPTSFLYQDGDITVFNDINPAAKIHVLFIPKIHISDISELRDEVLLKIKEKIMEKVRELNLVSEGYRIVLNGGKAMAIPHVHFHLLGHIDIARKVSDA